MSGYCPIFVFKKHMKPNSLSHTVYLEIRKKILSHQIPSGTRLIEGDWAKKLKVSRTAVREALTRLLGEHLVVMGERGGYYIKSITADNVREIREIREILEVGALRLAIEKMTDEEVEILAKICDDFTNMVKGGYLNGALEADMKFHESILLFTRNNKLMEAYHSSNIPLFHLKLEEVYTHMDDYELTDKEHRRILAAIENKDFIEARKALKEHLHRGEMASLDLE